MMLLLLRLVVLAQRRTALVRGMPRRRGAITRGDFVGAAESRSGPGRGGGDAVAEQVSPGRRVHGSGWQLGPFVGARRVAPVRQSHSFARRRARSRRARVTPVVERAGRLRWGTFGSQRGPVRFSTVVYFRTHPPRRALQARYS